MESSLPGDPRSTFAWLAWQLMLCTVTAGVLLGVLPLLTGAGVNAAMIWLSATLFHAVATLRLVDDAVDFLNLDCPKCSESFHGFPDQLPRPSRHECANCGADFA